MTTSEIILADRIGRLIDRWEEDDDGNRVSPPEVLAWYLAKALLDEGSPALICSLCERAIKNEPRPPDKDDWRNQ